MFCCGILSPTHRIVREHIANTSRREMHALTRKGRWFRCPEETPPRRINVNFPDVTRMNATSGKLKRIQSRCPIYVQVKQTKKTHFITSPHKNIHG